MVAAGSKELLRNEDGFTTEDVVAMDSPNIVALAETPTARTSPPPPLPTTSRPSERASCSPQSHPCSAGEPPGDPWHRGGRGGDSFLLPLPPRLLVVLGGVRLRVKVAEQHPGRVRLHPGRQLPQPRLHPAL
ncbi:hypothetical protein OsI_03419 [Oryza sativa Indica Group]|uniref:Uncharacterized protein n=1 Tax=Oryza sativa subsp. indica TaxID=39946 RepID=B8A8B2_ORYSI|nr:hypothetical protein OsI_03419 [Oryza sativa Indica Group]